MAQKFRTSLDLAQLNFIAQVLTTTEASPVMADSCLRSIRKTILKATTGIIAPHYSAQSVEEKLGISDTPSPKKIAYEKLKAYGETVCNKDELALAKDYAYENDLMSAEEEQAYEATLLTILENHDEFSYTSS